MNKNIIIAILVVIIIAGIGAFMFTHSNGKMDTQINFLNTKNTFQNGEQVQFELKDSQGKAISGQIIDITYNTKEKYSLTTDQNGKGYLTINGEAAGKYDIEVKYAGNDKYAGSTAKETITVTNDEADSPASQTDTSATADTNQYNNNQNTNDGSSSGSSSSSSGQGLNNTQDNPFPGSAGTHYLEQSGLWVRDSDNVIIDSNNGEGIGLTVDEWNSKYGYDSPDYH